MTSTFFHRELVSVSRFIVIVTTLPAETRSYKHPLNFLVWSHCYLECAYKPPPFYPQEVEAATTAILMEMNMNRKAWEQGCVDLHVCLQEQFIGTCVT